MVLVSDGVDTHSFITHVGFPNRYSKSAAFPRKHLPGLFQPPLGTLGGIPPAFLFCQIADKLASAEILAEEPGSFLIAATYEEPSSPLFRLGSPVQYSIDSRTRLISRIKGEVSMRMPAHDLTRIIKHTVSFENVIVDEPIPRGVFRFIPPADAVDGSAPDGRGRISFGGGAGGGGSFEGAGRSRVEHHLQHEWEGETLIERYKLRVHGIDLSFERRLTFSEDRGEVKISERVTGPKGETTHDLTVPLR